MQIIEFSEKPSEKYLYQRMLYVSCQYQSPYCATYSKKLFSRWQANLNNSPPTDSPTRWYRHVLECSTVASGGQEAFDFFFNKYQSLGRHDYSTGLLTILACTREPDVIQHLLQKTLESNFTEGFRKRDRINVITYVIDTPLSNGRAAILPFMSENFDDVFNEIESGHGNVISWFVYRLARYFLYCGTTN